MISTEDNNFTHALTVGIIASVLLHLSLLGILTTEIKLFSAKSPKVIEVSILPTLEPPTQAKRQIVTEPDNLETTRDPVKPARFLSEKTRTTEREQIKRGDGPDAGPQVGKKVGAPPPPAAPAPAPKKQAAPPQKPQAVAKRSAPTKPLSSLRLNDQNLFQEFGKEEPKKQSPKEVTRQLQQSSQVQSLSTYQAFSRPTGSGAKFLGHSGASDHLPNLPDGDITLLNTKASQYAVFVRRVATRVFSKLRASGWESLSAGDIRKMRDYSTVTAILSPEGKLLSVSILGASGSRRFDEVLLDAANNGASDPHPPKGALAADGNIHFIFKSRSWSRVGPSRGGRGLAEQRWLLLATGLG